MARKPTAGTPAKEPNRRTWRRRAAALAVLVLLVLVAFVVISRRPSLTSDEVQARAVALAWARAVGAKDGGVSWDNSAPAARGEMRAKAVQDDAQSTAPRDPPGSAYTAYAVKRTGAYMRVWTTRRAPDQPTTTSEIVLTKTDGRWGVVDSGTPGDSIDDPGRYGSKGAASQ